MLFYYALVNFYVFELSIEKRNKAIVKQCIHRTNENEFKLKLKYRK